MPPPQYYNNGPRSFGLWDGIFLWSLLNNLGRAGSSDWFSNHRDDPGYQQWRQEAERQAQTNAELRQRLDQLDKQLADKQAQPRDPTYLPPDVPPNVAAPPPERTPSVAAATGGSGIGWVLPVLLVGGGGPWLSRICAWSRARAAPGGSMTPLKQATNIVRHKLSGEGYTPDRFRVGMGITLDPTPFILAGSATHVPMPEGGPVSVAAVGTAESGGTRLTRLYLPGGQAFIQIHAGPDGMPDECRYFATIDEVAPADSAEWGSGSTATRA